MQNKILQHHCQNLYEKPLSHCNNKKKKNARFSPFILKVGVKLNCIVAQEMSKQYL